jgi:hypothetical protein
MYMGTIMDAAPITFPHNTPIDRVYDAFSKMNLVVIGIVSATTNKYTGVITRRQLLEFTGAAHHQHEKDEELKPFWQKVKESLFGDDDEDDDDDDDDNNDDDGSGFGERAPAPLAVQRQLMEYNNRLNQRHGHTSVLQKSPDKHTDLAPGGARVTRPSLQTPVKGHSVLGARGAREGNLA